MGRFLPMRSGWALTERDTWNYHPVTTWTGQLLEEALSGPGLLKPAIEGSI